MSRRDGYQPRSELIIGILLVLSALGLLFVDKANAAPSERPLYGGCAEAWQAPRSDGAAECRERGWLVKSRLVVSPSGYVKVVRVPRCAVEDDRNCYWNARVRGNRTGRSFVALGDRHYYVEGFRR